MPNSTAEARVIGVTGNIVRIESEAPITKNAVAFVHVGDAQLKGEVLRVQDRHADLQIFEETQGLQVGAQVTLTEEMLSAVLGPLLGRGRGRGTSIRDRERQDDRQIDRRPPL